MNSAKHTQDTIDALTALLLELAEIDFLHFTSLCERFNEEIADSLELAADSYQEYSDDNLKLLGGESGLEYEYHGANDPFEYSAHSHE